MCILTSRNLYLPEDFQPEQLLSHCNMTSEPKIPPQVGACVLLKFLEDTDVMSVILSSLLIYSTLAYSYYQITITFMSVLVRTINVSCISIWEKLLDMYRVHQFWETGFQSFRRYSVRHLLIFLVMSVHWACIFCQKSNSSTLILIRRQ